VQSSDYDGYPNAFGSSETIANMSVQKWKSALIGAGVCGLLGPGIGLLLLDLQIIDIHSFRNVSGLIVAAVKGWIFAFAAVGPAALILGGACGALLQILSRDRSTKLATPVAGALGLVLGGAVPVVTISVESFWFTGKYSFKNEVLSELPVACLTGVICALLLLWTFRGLASRCEPVGSSANKLS
jgi:hypothetical protein